MCIDTKKKPSRVFICAYYANEKCFSFAPCKKGYDACDEYMVVKCGALHEVYTRVYLCVFCWNGERVHAERDDFFMDQLFSAT